MNRISRVAAPMIVAGAAVLSANAVRAQDRFPDRPIRLVVPFPPGGQTDNVSRQFGAKIAPILGQQLIIDNRAGAAGTIGAGEAARAKPDGYTLLMATSSTHSIHPVMSKITYDAVKDFAPVRVIGTGPMTINVHPSVPSRSLRQLVADVKAHPGSYSYGTAGVGSVNHLGGELFKLRAGKLEILHVPYKGAGPALAELVAGQIPMTCSSLSGALPHHRSGRIRTLAVMKEERSPSAQDIPTTGEAGVPGAIAYTFNILLVPAGTPRSAIDHLNGALTRIMSDRGFADSLVKLGVDPIIDSNPFKAAAMIRTELDKWRPIIETLGLIQH
jgi:tripartite-type tricarboxylate transporter receptor subunit TctC